MFKRFMFIVLVVSMLASFVACGQSTNTNETITTGNSDQTTSQDTAATTIEQASKPEKLVIAYLPTEATETLADFRHAIQKDMEAALGVKVEEFLATDYNALVEAMRTGKADIANFGPLSYVQAHERANAEAIVAPALDSKKENCGYYSYIITQAKNDKINSINDLKGKKFAFVDPNSTSGNLVPSFEIIKAFSSDNLTIEDLHTNGKFFESVIFAGSHINTLQAVIKGDVDAAPVASDTFTAETTSGRADANAVKIIFESPMIPGSPIGVRGDLPEDFKKEIKDFYLKYDNDDYFKNIVGQKEGQKIRYIEVTNDDYKNIDDLRKQFGM